MYFDFYELYNLRRLRPVDLVKMSSLCIFCVFIGFLGGCGRGVHSELLSLYQTRAIENMDVLTFIYEGNRERAIESLEYSIDFAVLASWERLQSIKGSGQKEETLFIRSVKEFRRTYPQTPFKQVDTEQMQKRIEIDSKIARIFEQIQESDYGQKDTNKQGCGILFGHPFSLPSLELMRAVDNMAVLTYMYSGNDEAAIENLEYGIDFAVLYWDKSQKTKGTKQEQQTQFITQIKEFRQKYTRTLLMHLSNNEKMEKRREMLAKVNEILVNTGTSMGFSGTDH